MGLPRRSRYKLVQLCLLREALPRKNAAFDGKSRFGGVAFETDRCYNLQGVHRYCEEHRIEWMHRRNAPKQFVGARGIVLRSAMRRYNPSDKSFHSGFSLFIRSSFFCRKPALICFSLAMVSIKLLNSSRYTKMLTLYLRVNEVL